VNTRLCILVAFVLFLPFHAAAQSESPWLTEEWYYDTEPVPLTDAVRFLPSVPQASTLLKRYLRDERFYQLRKSLDDTVAVDAIYDRALLLTDGDIGKALLVAMLGVMDHQRLGLKLPLFGTVYLPLTSESDSLFKLRRTHLPKRVMADGRRGTDKDKLQHFFGSAYLAYTVNSNIFAEFIGDLIEEWEQRFVMGGTTDTRDQAANAKGREFGSALQDDPELLPSTILWDVRP
jgi:hypothetical protein